jgi:hypothetical protein
MNLSKCYFLFVFYTILFFIQSCTFSKKEAGLSPIFGLNLSQKINPQILETDLLVQDFWNRIQEDSDLEIKGEFYNWTPVFSGSNPGLLLVVEGHITKTNKDKDIIKYKGEQIYRYDNDIYRLALGGYLYYSTFPTALQTIIQNNGIELTNEARVHVDHLLGYWSSILDDANEEANGSIALSFVNEGSFILSPDVISKPLDSLFNLSLKPLIKERDSYFRSVVNRTDFGDKSLEESYIDRCMIWRDGALMLIYDNRKNLFKLGERNVIDQKTVYGMADILQLEEDWNVTITTDKTYRLENVFVFEWEGMLIVSTNYNMLESMLSSLILEEIVLASNQDWPELARFSAKDLKAFLVEVLGFSEGVQSFIPEEGFYTFSEEGESYKIDYSESKIKVEPILIQNTIRDKVGEVYTFFNAQGRQFFVYQDSREILHCIDKHGKTYWYLPLESKLDAFHTIDDIGLIKLGSKLDYIDLGSGTFADIGPSISLVDIDTFGLIKYQDRPANENKLWLKNKAGNVEIVTIDQSLMWSLDFLDEMKSCSNLHFRYSDTMDYVLQFCGDSLYGNNINGNPLFPPIAMQENSWARFYDQNSAGLRRMIYPLEDGRVKVFNELGQHFNLFIQKDMKDLLLGNMNSGPKKEFIAYTDNLLTVSGYIGNEFKTFSTYRSKDFIESVQYAQTPKGQYLACFKDQKIEILNNQLEVVTSFNSPSHDQAYFYFSDFDSALDLVLLDGDKILNFILEEL